MLNTSSIFDHGSQLPFRDLLNIQRRMDRLFDELWYQAPAFTLGSNAEEERNEKSGSERHWSTFERAFRVPAGTKSEQVEAQYADGVLRIAVPKTEAAKAQPVKISDGKTGFWEELLGHKKEIGGSPPSKVSSEQRVIVKVV